MESTLWRDEGKDVSHLTTLDEVIEAAGLDFPMVLCQVKTMLPDGNERLEENQFNVVRSDTNVTLTRKTVAGSYGLLQNKNLLDIARQLMEQGCTPDAAGVIEDGRRVFCVLNFPEDESTVTDVGSLGGQAEDIILPRIGIFAANDGSGSVVAKLMSLRMWCNNMYQAAIGQKGYTIHMKHSKNVHDRLAEATNVLKNMREEWIRRIDFYKALRSKPLPFDQAQMAARRILKIDTEKPYDELPTKSRNRIEALLGEFNNPERGAFGKTAFDMFNAVTAYNTHTVNTKKSRLDYAALGDGAKREDRAMRILAEMIGYDLKEE